MPPLESIREWTAEVMTHFPNLSRPQANGLALWSYGVQTLQCCGQSRVSAFLAELLGEKTDATRQRLREWTCEKGAKKGAHRREVVVATGFVYLLKWVLSGLAPDEKRLALALDATTIKQRFVVLTISVLYCGCAIPIAWQVLPATQAGTWRPYWLGLLTSLQTQVPADWQVLVMADRGLFAHWLYRAIRAAGWHPFLRINTGGKCRPAGASEFQPLTSLLPARAQSWQGAVTCFKTNPLAATLLIYRDAQHDHPWLILTDLAPQVAQVGWYGLRAWIEGQFKDIKGGGFQWQYTRMHDPERVSRLWLVLAVALLYTVSLGSQAEAQRPASMLDDLPIQHIARRTATGRRQPRRLSLVTRGHLVHLAKLILNQLLPTVRLPAANPWPTIP